MMSLTDKAREFLKLFIRELLPIEIGSFAGHKTVKTTIR